MADEPHMTMLMVALPNKHGGGGPETGARLNGQSRIDDGEVRSERELVKAMAAPIRKLLKDVGLDPSITNAAIVAFRVNGKINATALIVKPGDVSKGEFVSFEASTEKEWFSIANGPEPKRFPFSKMPQPVGMVVGIDEEGGLADPIVGAPPADSWIDVPIDWKDVPGLPADLQIPEGMQASRNGPVRQQDLKRVPVDPFVTDVTRAIAMEPPGLRDIRRIGIDNGFRDESGGMVA
jgi:hypothetical protein